MTAQRFRSCSLALGSEIMVMPPNYKKTLALLACIICIAAIDALAPGREALSQKDVETPDGKNERGEHRLNPNMVNLSNVETFKAQIQRDLPAGTSKQEVEKYLSSLNLPYHFAEPGPGPGTNMFYTLIENLGWWGPFMTGLAIRIQLDGSAKVERIAFRFDYL